MQYTGFLLPKTLKFGRFVQDLCKQKLPRTFTIPSSACCLQNTGILLSTRLKLGRLAHESCKQLLSRTFTMPPLA